MKDSKNYVIGALCLMLCLMAVGFAAFSSNLKVNSTASIDSNSKWAVRLFDPSQDSISDVSSWLAYDPS